MAFKFTELTFSISAQAAASTEAARFKLMASGQVLVNQEVLACGKTNIPTVNPIAAPSDFFAVGFADHEQYHSLKLALSELLFNLEKAEIESEEIGEVTKAAKAARAKAAKSRKKNRDEDAKS